MDRKQTHFLKCSILLYNKINEDNSIERVVEHSFSKVEVLDYEKSNTSSDIIGYLLSDGNNLSIFEVNRYQEGVSPQYIRVTSSFEKIKDGIKNEVYLTVDFLDKMSNEEILNDIILNFEAAQSGRIFNPEDYFNLLMINYDKDLNETSFYKFATVIVDISKSLGRPNRKVLCSATFEDLKYDGVVFEENLSKIKMDEPFILKKADRAVSYALLVPLTADIQESVKELVAFVAFEVNKELAEIQRKALSIQKFFTTK